MSYGVTTLYAAVVSAGVSDDGVGSQAKRQNLMEISGDAADDVTQWIE